jgi:hypothetical protein
MIGHPLDLLDLVVVRQNNRIPLILQAQDLRDEIRGVG